MEEKFKKLRQYYESIKDKSAEEHDTEKLDPKIKDLIDELFKNHRWEYTQRLKDNWYVLLNYKK